MNKNLSKEGIKTRFSSTNQPNKNGRYPSRLKAEIIDKQISIEDVRIAFKYIMDMNEKEIRELVADKEKNYLLRCLAKAFQYDYKKGNLSNVTTMLNRIYGMPKEVIEHTVNDITEMSKDERLKRLEELEKIAKERENANSST